MYIKKANYHVVILALHLLLYFTTLAITDSTYHPSYASSNSNFLPLPKYHQTKLKDASKLGKTYERNHQKN